MIRGLPILCAKVYFVKSVSAFWLCLPPGLLGDVDRFGDAELFPRALG
jgi:hypothetical protein